MPAKAPPSNSKMEKVLSDWGRMIRATRKNLRISAISTAEAARISRMTLNRIERGETSITIGALLNVTAVLGLYFELLETKKDKTTLRKSKFNLPKKIRVLDYPQLQQLAWQLKNTTEMTPRDALTLYERNWRHVDLNKMSFKERELLQGLIATLGKGRLLV